MKRTRQRLYVSATPARFEIQNSIVGNTNYFPNVKKADIPEGTPERLPRLSGADIPVGEFDTTTPGKDLIVEQIIRPTGLLDPIITVRPLKGQIDETIEQCRLRVEIGQRVLVTTLTKRTAEDLTDYLRGVGLKVRYMHSDINTVERVEILRALRLGEFDVLVGINLLREGLDLPEVSLVCILDADKEGYLRSETSLIQTAGRAARHINGEVFLFADIMTKSIQALIGISTYRRRKQQEYNTLNNIIPRSTVRHIQESLHAPVDPFAEHSSSKAAEGGPDDTAAVIAQLQEEMVDASRALEFERAAMLRDQINELKALAAGQPIPKGSTKTFKVNYLAKAPRKKSKR